MELNERLDRIEWRQELLFNNCSIDRLLFQYDVTREQWEQISDLFEQLIQEVEKGNVISSYNYETKIHKIVPQHKYDYHFAEYIAQSLYEDDKYTEVFYELYKDSQKHQVHFK